MGQQAAAVRAIVGDIISDRIEQDLEFTGDPAREPGPTRPTHKFRRDPIPNSMPGAAYVCLSLVIVVSSTPAKLLANR